jgi:hypothetical protein
VLTRVLGWRLQVAAGALLLSAPVLGHQSTEPKDTVLSLLAHYDAGRYTDVDRLLAGQPKGPLADALRKEGDRWVKTGSAASLDRRRLVAGSVALEIVGAGLTDEWFLVYDAIEWGCRHVIATASVSDAERQWHLASIALLQAGAGMLPTAQFAEGHIALHAPKRVPNSSRIRLGMLIEEEHGIPMLPPRRSGVPDLPAETRRRIQVRAADLVKHYVELMSAPEVADEARLRISVLQYELGSLDNAIDGLAPLRQSSDPFIGYIASFLTGEAARRLGRDGGAITAYRQALTVVPNAMSASLGLSAVLSASGDFDGSLAVVNAAATTKAPIDPWRIYAFGSGRHWPQWRDGLRSEMRR